MTQFKDFFDQLPNSMQTEDVQDWLDQAEAKDNEKIPNGLIVEMSDVLEHPFDEGIWHRFINALTFLVRHKPYYLKVISNINLIQQFNIEIIDFIEAPMAVSLLNQSDLLKSTDDVEIDYHQQPTLFVNPKALWTMMIDVYKGQITSNEQNIFDTIIGLIVHETYHILRGDLIRGCKYHYASPEANERYARALEKQPLDFEISGHPVEVSDLGELQNILSDASINADIIMNVSNEFFPTKLQKASITPLSTTDAFQKIIDFSKGDQPKVTKPFKTTMDFGIQSTAQFFDDGFDFKKKQYSILEMLDAQSDDDDSEGNNEGDNEDDNESGDSEGEKGESDSDGDNNSNPPLSDSDIQNKHNNATENTSEDNMDNAASKINNLVNVANNEAQNETNGQGQMMSPDGELQERVVKIQKAKALPKLDKKVKSIIKDFNSKKRLNWHRRHIAYPNRLDMAHHEKLITDGGFYAYVDVSGSISDELVSNLFSILYETVKQEPCYLYIFASTMVDEPLEITRKSSINDIFEFINDHPLDIGTNFEPVFEHITKTSENKHAIFSDYLFDDAEYAMYRQQVKTTPIIHVVEDIRLLQMQQGILYKDILANRSYHKLIQQSDYMKG